MPLGFDINEGSLNKLKCKNSNIAEFGITLIIIDKNVFTDLANSGRLFAFVEKL